MNNSDLLKKLAEKRMAHFQSLKRNHDQSHNIIGEQLYSKQSHFIFELLQNAEDEKANKIKISFDNEKLIFEHNGRPFDIEDIEAITSFGNNERKKLKSNAIGRFGIGFKSVFSVTEKPEIKSGNFHFTISNFIVPALIDSEKTKATIITLPFKKSIKNQIISRIKSTLNTLDSTYLLFLNNINLIEIVDLNNSEIRFLKLRKSNSENSNFRIFRISENGNEKEFMIFENNISIAKKKLPIKIAFSINRKTNKFIFEPIKPSPLFAFFATEKETNLPFYIHAPFLTTPARDNIISDNEKNDNLFLALTNLLITAIDQLKLNNLIDLNTWLVFPCDISYINNDIYALFCNSFFRYLKVKKTSILPSDDEKFCHVDSAMKVKNKEFKSLINTKETKILFGRTEWVTEKISKPEFKTVNTWIEQQYKVPTVGFKEFCEKINESYFTNKSDDWLFKFYKSISESTELWKASNGKNPAGPLRNKPFIRTSKNKTVNLFDTNGKLNVYLPSGGTSDYQFVKNIFLADIDSRRLFKSLNITTPDLIAEVIEHVIPRLEKTDTPYKGLKEDIQKIFRAIRRADYEDEKTIIKKLRDIAWLPGRNIINKKIILNKPDEIYFPSRDLAILLNKANTAIFLDSTLFNDHKSKQNALSILEDLGVYFKPRRFYKQDDDLVFENKNTINQTYWNSNNVELEGLTEYLSKTVDKKNSINLWNILIKSSHSWKTSGFANTKFIKQLKETRWIFNKFGQRQKPNEITTSELDEAYEVSSILMNVLEFKADEIKDFEIEHEGKFLTNDEFQTITNEMKKLMREIERLKKQYEPIIENDSENNLPLIDDIIIGEELSSDYTQNSDDDIPDDHQIDYFNNSDSNNSGVIIINSVPTNRQKKIGIRGEEFVLKLLKELYQSDKSIEITNLNEYDKLGVGCDIIIKKNGLAQTFIEVKATEGGFENKFKISQKQWMTAIKSYLNDDEPDYHIYCVYYAGSINPQYIIIENPIEWMFKKQMRFIEQWFNIRSIKSN